MDTKAPVKTRGSRGKKEPNATTEAERYYAFIKPSGQKRVIHQKSGVTPRNMTSMTRMKQDPRVIEYLNQTQLSESAQNRLTMKKILPHLTSGGFVVEITKEEAETLYQELDDDSSVVSHFSSVSTREPIVSLGDLQTSKVMSDELTKVKQELRLEQERSQKLMDQLNKMTINIDAREAVAEITGLKYENKYLTSEIQTLKDQLEAYQRKDRIQKNKRNVRDARYRAKKRDGDTADE